jgi:hypothetical protein
MGCCDFCGIGIFTRTSMRRQCVPHCELDIISVGVVSLYITEHSPVYSLVRGGSLNIDTQDSSLRFSLLIKTSIHVDLLARKEACLKMLGHVDDPLSNCLFSTALRHRCLNSMVRTAINASQLLMNSRWSGARKRQVSRIWIGCYRSTCGGNMVCILRTIR